MISGKLLSFEQELVGRKILITGHTGFTGGWASLWLNSIGARLRGYSLPSDTSPSFFHSLDLSSRVETVYGDICNYDALHKAVVDFEPELILHLAAQPLVRRSYREPLRTFEVNSQGTVHVLEAARAVSSVRGVLCITTDKVYRNNEWIWPYRENDPLGGKDPYSASKSAMEMVVQSYMASFPWEEGKGPAIAIARGGNIIGGGDWSEDRIIPDFVRALISNNPLMLRYPNAIRPWQHVLALVQGYLQLLAGLISSDPATFAQAWNFGPQDSKYYSVQELLEIMGTHWQRPILEFESNPLPESNMLALDSTKARNLLSWCPPWDTQRVAEKTAEWYRDYLANPTCAYSLTMSQILEWRSDLMK